MPKWLLNFTAEDSYKVYAAYENFFSIDNILLTNSASHDRYVLLL